METHQRTKSTNTKDKKKIRLSKSSCQFQTSPNEQHWYDNQMPVTLTKSKQNETNPKHFAKKQPQQLKFA